MMHRLPLLGLPLGAPYRVCSETPALPQIGPPQPRPDPEPAGGRVDVAAQIELLIDPSTHHVTPLGVQAKRFRRVRQGRGYDMRAVDDYLDLVAAELIGLHQEIFRLREGLQRATRAGGGQVQTAPSLARVHACATRLAADIVADAVAEADRIRASASRQAAQLRGDAGRPGAGDPAGVVLAANQDLQVKPGHGPAPSDAGMALQVPPQAAGSRP